MGWHNEVGPGERETGGANRGEKVKEKLVNGNMNRQGKAKGTCVVREYK